MSTSTATLVLLPKFGNSVESSIIVRWLKQIGESVAEGEALCEVETDKATIEVPSPAAGVLLEQRVAVGDDVPVQTPIALVGDRGRGGMERAPQSVDRGLQPALTRAISPRARNLADRVGLDSTQLVGSGPGGRVIERDVQAALAAQPKLTPLAKSMLAKGGFLAPQSGSGPGGRVLGKDLVEESLPAAPQGNEVSSAIRQPDSETEPGVKAVPITNIRRVIAQRMHASLHTTAQLTQHRTADARQLQALRKRFKASPESLGLRAITINDLMLFAIARTLLQHPELNALFSENTVYLNEAVHLGLAVETPRGLLVPVIRNAHMLSLRDLSSEARRLAEACQTGKATPDQLNGGTFTVSNLGSLGIDSFTPILNLPQVAVLGIGAIALKPIETDDSVAFIPHIGLSLTINHQVVDGAPAARFLQQLAEYIANLDLVLAI